MSVLDTLLVKALRYVGLNKTYESNEFFRQFMRYGISITVIYWLAKAPLIWMLTEILHIHYVMSSFLIGLLITILGFFVEKYFVFRREKR